MQKAANGATLTAGMGKLCNKLDDCFPRDAGVNIV